MPDVTLTSLRIIPSPVPSRLVQGKKDTLVTYITDAKEQYSVIVEGETPTEQDIKTAIMADLKVQQHKGKVLKIP